MTTYREHLIDRMIALYGLENPMVIQFAQMCEDYHDTEWNDTVLRLIVEANEADPYFEED